MRAAEGGAGRANNSFEAWGGGDEVWGARARLFGGGGTTSSSSDMSGERSEVVVVVEEEEEEEEG